MSLMKRLLEEMESNQAGRDGRLNNYDPNDWRHPLVWLRPDCTKTNGSQLVVIYGKHGNELSYVCIDSQQALSLFEWLQQQQSKLEQLAKE